MDKLGRRSLMLGGLAMMTLSYVGLGLSQYMHKFHAASWTSPLALLTLVTFIIGFAVGPGTIVRSLSFHPSFSRQKTFPPIFVQQVKFFGTFYGRFEGHGAVSLKPAINVPKT